MKKTYIYIVTLSIVLIGLLQFTSCKKDNDWDVDTSVLKQRPPSSFKVELKDVKTLAIHYTIGTVAGATAYEIQRSQSPLSSNGDLPVEGEILSVIVNYTSDGDLELDEGSTNFPQVQPGNTYYYRIRAIGKDGSVSNWFTNGSLYNGGVSDPELQKRLIENTYIYDSDKNSYATLIVPTLTWSSGADIEENSIILRWHEISYATIKYLRYETIDGTGTTTLDISNAEQDGYYQGDEKTKAYKYNVTGLEASTKYVFLFLDENENVLSTTTVATEFAPNMSLARSILVYTEEQVIGEKGVPLTLVDPDYGDFKVILNQDYKANAGWSTSTYYCQTPDKKVHVSNNRFQLKDKTTISYEVPADGRLYLYVNGTPTTYKVTQEGEEDKEITVNKDDKEYIQDEGGINRNCFKFVKVRLKKGKTTFTPTAPNAKSCYYFGFVFVPDDANAGQE